MKTLLTLFSLLLSISICHAQQIDLTGQVSIHNSRYRTGQIEYVANASVQAPFAGETTSDDAGKWVLTFQGLEVGSNTALSVEKAGWEVVNERDILNVVLGRQEPLKVFFAKKGELAQRQTEFYDISLAALTSEYNEIRLALQKRGKQGANAIKKLEQQLGLEIDNRYEAEAHLNDQLEQAKKQLPEMSKRLAVINLDFASSTYQKAYLAFEQGDPQAVLNILSEQELSEQSAEIKSSLANIEHDQQTLQEAIILEQEKAIQIYNSYELKADAYLLTFNYPRAAEVFRKGVDLLGITKDQADMELADSYERLISLLLDAGQPQAALNYAEQLLNIRQKFLPSNDPDIGSVYNLLALIYTDLGDLDQALEAQKRDIAIVDQHPGYDVNNRAASYNNLAAIYQERGQYEEALAAQLKAVAILEIIWERQHESVATAYNNLAVIYGAMENYPEAIEWHQRAIALRKKVLAPNDPAIGHSFNNLALIYTNLGQFDKALSLQEQALRLFTQAFGPDHPKVAVAYNTLSLIYNDLQWYEQAIETQQKAIAIKEDALGSGHPWIATSYNNLAIAYFFSGAYTKAEKTANKAYRILKQKGGTPNDLVQNYLGLAMIANAQEKTEEAITYQEKAIMLLQQNKGKEHPSIAEPLLGLANLYRKSAQYERAIASQQEGVSVLENAEAADSILLAKSYNNLAVLYGKLPRQKALQMQFLGKAAAIQEKILGSNAIALATTYQNMAQICLEQMQLDSAILLGHRTLGILKEAYPVEHPQVQDVRSLLAWAHSHRGKRNFDNYHLLDAIYDYKMAVEFSNNPPAVFYVNLCVMHTLTGEVHAALEYAREAVKLGYRDWDWIKENPAFTALTENWHFEKLMQTVDKNND